ncbi:hypothetical protein DLAC_09533 [Tieghemostelium lacteum]|uniref:Uncharacterized protein n=1 Tax=Tieghemostelium lacteum TaxID=361077 RepID=A0A151Z6L3_TIELA|nr:hypothetical protein DLAC_09533 [Tieghemostelium lacteum]|eukprot:KYQ89577.1 hypothetical protein DLAC_09533 [Tieghemostelium lacteum]
MVLKDNDNNILPVKFNKTASLAELRKVKIPVQSGGKEFKLEGLLAFIPKEKNANFCTDDNDGIKMTNLQDVGVVITHPHPMLGGNLNNNVVMGVSEYIVYHLQVPVLSLNFRGVGNSEGVGSWRGSYEREDTKAAASYLVNQSMQDMGYKINRVIMIGYSYGSVIAGSVIDEIPEVIAYTAISYPFGPLTFMLLGPLLQSTLDSLKPKFFVTGDQDNFTSTSTFKKRLSQMKGEDITFKIIPNLDHFYGGSENKLSREILKWIYFQIFKDN